MNRTPVPIAIRREVANRAAGCCERCGMTEEEAEGINIRFGGLTIHHVAAASAGGPNTPENLQLLCDPCHLIADRTNGAAVGSGRPKGSGAKPIEEKFVGLHLRLPVSELEAFQAAVPAGQRAQFVRKAILEAIKRRNGSAPHHARTPQQQQEQDQQE